MTAITSRWPAAPEFARVDAIDTAAGARLCFVRTEAGDVEVLRQAIDLPDVARDLLFAIEPNLTIDQCVGVVQGARLADAMLLLSFGLVRTLSFEAATPVRSGTAGLLPMIDRLLALPPDQLYGLLTQQAKHRLGLLQGFRMVLALERCSDPHEQQALAVHFVREIWRAHGTAGLLPLQRLLSA